jgi:hypothetical protein
MKTMIIFIILLLSSCEAKNTTNTIYVASLTVDKKDDIYNGYFYIPSSIEVGSEAASGDAKGKIGEAKSEKIIDLFYEISFSASLKISFAHISTLILHESILNYDDINELLQFLKNSNRFDFNFYILSTNVSGKDIYSLTSSNNEKLITTMIVEPQNAMDVFVSTPPIHYLNFSRDFYSNKTIKLPLIETKKEWELDDEVKSYMARGISFINKEKTNVYSYQELDFRYLTSSKGLFISERDISFTIINYNVDIKYKESIEIKVSGRIENYDKKINIDPNQIIKDKINNLINELKDECDFININYYNNLSKKKYNIDNIVYNIKITT